jgi:hypothetical protein
VLGRRVLNPNPAVELEESREQIVCSETKGFLPLSAHRSARLDTIARFE